jgi:predicted GNAT family acetyltransferase
MDLVSRLRRFLAASAAGGREVVPVPPFTAYLDRQDPLKFLNYAIPDRDADPGPAEIEALRSVFRDRERLPRLEWIEETAPRVASALEAAGMAQELQTPLMACRPNELAGARCDVADLVVSAVGAGEVRECTDLQREAFQQPPLGEKEMPRDPSANGGGAVLARAGGIPVAAANWTTVIDGVSEVAGVATAEPWRRRGLAGVVTAAAARVAFSAGASLCVLSPGDDTAQRVYARAGFRRVATMLHWSDPA